MSVISLEGDILLFKNKIGTLFTTSIVKHLLCSPSKAHFENAVKQDFAYVPSGILLRHLRNKKGISESVNGIIIVINFLQSHKNILYGLKDY